MKKALLTYLFGSILLSGFSQDDNTENTPPSQAETKTTAIRAEFLGRSPLGGIVADELVYKTNKVDLHMTLGYSRGVGYGAWSYSAYAITGKSKLKPMFGLGAFVDVGATVTSGFRGQSELNFYLISLNIMPIIGGDFKINDIMDVQFYYSPLTTVYLGNSNITVYPLYAGINVGFLIL